MSKLTLRSIEDLYKVNQVKNVAAAHTFAIIDAFEYNWFMKFHKVAAQLAHIPLFESGLFYAGADTPQKVQRQLADWVRAGKLARFRRGLYAFAPPYQTEKPHSYLIANRLVCGSYVSLHAALSYYDLIPEHVAVVTSVTTGRPNSYKNRYGHFSYRHIQPTLFFGFQYWQVTPSQWAYLATPEKALLDLVYLTPDGASSGYLRALRLQNLDQLNPGRLNAYVQRANKPKFNRALGRILQIVEQEATAYVTL